MQGESSFCNIRRETTLSYLAGLLDGEATFLMPPPSDRHWQVYGSRAVAVMQAVEPVLGIRRRDQIRVAHGGYPTPARRVPSDRLARNQEIARRLATGESGPNIARAFGMTHQNVYYIAKRYGLDSSPTAVSTSRGVSRGSQHEGRAAAS